MTHFFFSPPSTRRGEKHAAHKTTTVNAQRRQYIYIFFWFVLFSVRFFSCFNFLPRAVKKIVKVFVRGCCCCFHFSTVFCSPSFSFHVHAPQRERASSESKSQHKKVLVGVCRAKQFPISALKVLGAFDMRSKNSARTELTKYNKKLIFYFYFALLHWASQNTSRSRRNQQYYLIILLFSPMQELSKWEWIWKTLQYLRTEKKRTRKFCT